MILWGSSYDGLVVMNPPANDGYSVDAGSIPESGRSPGEGNDIPLQYSYLGNPTDRGNLMELHRVAKSQTEHAGTIQCFIEEMKYGHFSASLTSEDVIEMFSRRKRLFHRDLAG